MLHRLKTKPQKDTQRSSGSFFPSDQSQLLNSHHFHSVLPETTKSFPTIQTSGILRNLIHTSWSPTKESKGAVSTNLDTGFICLTMGAYPIFGRMTSYQLTINDCPIKESDFCCCSPFVFFVFFFFFWLALVRCHFEEITY